MAHGPRGNDSKTDDESRRILERVERDSEVVGTSALVRSAEKARDHLAGADVDQKDAVELWGTRIGRGLGVIGFVALAIWLVMFLTRSG